MRRYGVSNLRARGVHLNRQLRSLPLAALPMHAAQIIHHLPDGAAAASSYTRG